MIPSDKLLNNVKANLTSTEIPRKEATNTSQARLPPGFKHLVPAVNKNGFPVYATLVKMKRILPSKVSHGSNVFQSDSFTAPQVFNQKQNRLLKPAIIGPAASQLHGSHNLQQLLYLAPQVRYQKPNLPLKPAVLGPKGGFVFLPPNRTLNYKSWTSDDVAAWISIFLESVTGVEQTIQKIRIEDIDGVMLELVASSNKVRDELSIPPFQYNCIQKNAAALINEFNSNQYKIQLDEYLRQLVLWQKQQMPTHDE